MTMLGFTHFMFRSLGPYKIHLVNQKGTTMESMGRVENLDLGIVDARDCFLHVSCIILTA